VCTGRRTRGDSRAISVASAALEHNAHPVTIKEPINHLLM